MNKKTVTLSDEEFFYSHIDEYLDDDLPQSERQRFESITKDHDPEMVLKDYGTTKGQLQLGLQKLFVDDHLTHQLHILVEDDAARANHEASDIEDYSKAEVFGRVVSGVIIAVGVLAAIVSAYLFLGPKSKPSFSALDSLVYEAAVMIEDPQGRLDFPTESLAELRDYFSRYPNLGFRAKSFDSPGKDWRLEGGTVIDYEVQKIMATQFGKSDKVGKLFFFVFEGQLEDFPSSELGNFRGLMYQTYASDYFNVLVWQVNDGIVGMAVGSEKAEKLAQAALNSVGL